MIKSVLNNSQPLVNQPLESAYSKIDHQYPSQHLTSGLFTDNNNSMFSPSASSPLQMIMSFGNRFNPNLINNFFTNEINNSDKITETYFNNNNNYNNNNNNNMNNRGSNSLTPNKPLHYSKSNDYLRKRYNSCSTYDLMQMDHLNNRHEFSQTPQKKDYYSNTSSENESNFNLFGNFNAQPRVSQSLGRETNFIQANNKFEPEINGQKTNQRQITCLDESCTSPQLIDSEGSNSSVRFVCGSCQSIRLMHKNCYQRNILNSLNSLNYDDLSHNSENFNQGIVDLKFPCPNCVQGLFYQFSSSLQLSKPTNFIPMPPTNNNEQFTPSNNHNNHCAKTSQILVRKPAHQLINHKPPISSPNSSSSFSTMRKKSLNLSNPPLPTPMQSLQESRSPSPNTHFSTFTQKPIKKQSAPVNISAKNRYRTMSQGSTGSFSASSSFSSSFGTIVSPNQKKINSQPINSNETTNLEIVDEKLAFTGNMFHTRNDWSILSQVPFNKQNAVHIRLEDDGPYGNDETRCFLLSLFSTLNIREICCVLCKNEMHVYDRFPLVDGTFFLSPLSYEPKCADDDLNNNRVNDGKKAVVSVLANVANRNQFIHAICVRCLYARNALRCKWCRQCWSGGESLQIGTMYRYEIFAAFPCCQQRFACKKCERPIVDFQKTGGLAYFSSYSEEVECPHCKTKDFHFVKSLEKFYDF